MNEDDSHLTPTGKRKKPAKKKLIDLTKADSYIVSWKRPKKEAITIPHLP